jgi:TonB family protein
VIAKNGRSPFYAVLATTLALLAASTFAQWKNESKKDFKITVDERDAVTVDGKPIKSAEVDSVIRDIANQRGSVWYYRKGTREQPDPIVRRILRAGEKYDVGVVLCDKPDFSDAPRPGDRRPNPEATALSTPTPQYTDEAKKKHLRGSGYFDLHIDPYTGSVLSVHIKQSTGQALLDTSAITAFRHWRFRPNAIPSNRVRVPVTF